MMYALWAFVIIGALGGWAVLIGIVIAAFKTTQYDEEFRDHMGDEEPH